MGHVWQDGVKRNLRQPGVEPGAKAWEASMLPIHHWRSCYSSDLKKSGGAGFRSLCLPIANRPLYRVSYTPGYGCVGAKSEVQAMGFEPMPLARLAPKASALTTRPNLQRRKVLEGEEQRNKKKKDCSSSPWGDSNPQPPDPKSDALSIAPQGRTRDMEEDQAKKLSTTVGFEPTRAKPINLAG